MFNVTFIIIVILIIIFLSNNIFIATLIKAKRTPALKDLDSDIYDRELVSAEEPSSTNSGTSASEEQEQDDDSRYGKRHARRRQEPEEEDEEEEESPRHNKPRGQPRDRNSGRRRAHNGRRRHPRSVVDDDDSCHDNSDVATDMYSRRSRRQRKDISYKFEEFEELISTAIKSDVKAVEEVGEETGQQEVTCDMQAAEGMG